MVPLEKGVRGADKRHKKCDRKSRGSPETTGGRTKTEKKIWKMGGSSKQKGEFKNQGRGERVPLEWHHYVPGPGEYRIRPGVAGRRWQETPGGRIWKAGSGGRLKNLVIRAGWENNTVGKETRGEEERGRNGGSDKLKQRAPSKSPLQR